MPPTTVQLEHILSELILSFHQTNSGYETQVIQLGGNLNLLSQLNSLKCPFLKYSQQVKYQQWPGFCCFILKLYNLGPQLAQTSRTRIAARTFRFRVHARLTDVNTQINDVFALESQMKD